MSFIQDHPDPFDRLDLSLRWLRGWLGSQVVLSDGPKTVLTDAQDAFEEIKAANDLRIREAEVGVR